MPARAILPRLSQQEQQRRRWLRLSLTLSTTIPSSMIYCCSQPWRHHHHSRRIRLVEQFPRQQRLRFPVCLLLLLLLCAPPLLLPSDALSLPAQPRREAASRYFTEYFEFPPLERCTTDSSSSNINQKGNRVMKRPNLPVLYTNDPKSVSHWLSDNVPRSGCTLGFDMEDKTKFVGPATIQLASTHSSLVVHLTRANGRPSGACGPLLEAVFRDQDIVKAGCGIDQDMLELRQARWPGLEATSRLDLGQLGRKAHGQTLGLKTLTQLILELDLPKSKNLARSDWSQVPLCEKQLAYAARDAWVAAAMVDELAAIDPDTFDTTALVQRLQQQRTMQEIAQRQSKRKQAKMLLHALLAPYQLSEKGPKGRVRQSQLDNMPSWKFKKVQELQMQISSNSWNGNEFEDVEIVGMAVASRNSTA